MTEPGWTFRCCPIGFEDEGSAQGWFRRYEIEASLPPWRRAFSQ